MSREPLRQVALVAAATRTELDTFDVQVLAIALAEEASLLLATPYNRAQITRAQTAACCRT